MNRCATCKWLGRHSEEWWADAGRQPNPPECLNPAVGAMLYCDDSYYKHPGDLAIHVTADFGCVKHEPKEADRG